jgi:ribonuclease P protein component
MPFKDPHLEPLSPTEDCRFLTAYRIRRGADFQRTYDRKCSASDGRLLVFGCPNGLPHSRIGLSVSRKVGGAIIRNRWKRLIREAFRLTRPKLPAGVDLVIIPRAPEPPTLAQLAESLEKLSSRIAKKLLSLRQ